MADFTAHAHPTLAVSCPTCGAKVGGWCVQPDHQVVARPREPRRAEAERLLIAQHGPGTAIVRDGRSWIIETPVPDL